MVVDPLTPTGRHTYAMRVPTMLTLPPACALAQGLTGPLTLRRGWPKGAERAALEYVDARGAIVPAQWFADVERGAAVARATHRAAGGRGAVVQLAGGALVLQLGGADRKLTGLAAWLERPGATLIVHRPERRAVVRLDPAGAAAADDAAAEGVRFAKVLPPAKAATMVRQLNALAALAQGKLRIPTILETDLARGVVVMAALPGQSLHALLGAPGAHAHFKTAGAALRTLHALTPPADTVGHDAVSHDAVGHDTVSHDTVSHDTVSHDTVSHDAHAEVGVMRQWLARVEDFAPALRPQLAVHADRVADALTAAGSPAVLLHRDFYDKQVIVDDDGTVGLLDFDTLAVGEAALDVANALVHMALRAPRLGWSAADVQRAGHAFLAGYQPDGAVLARIPAYADATRLRLACVYAMRPPEHAAVAWMAAQIGGGVAGLS